MAKGAIACDKQLLLLQQCFFNLFTHHKNRTERIFTCLQCFFKVVCFKKNKCLLQVVKSSWYVNRLNSIAPSIFSFCDNALLTYSHITTADLKSFSHVYKAFLKSSAASKKMSAGSKEFMMAWHPCNIRSLRFYII